MDNIKQKRDKEQEEKIRRNKIAVSLSEIITKTSDLSVANLLCSIMRRKGKKSVLEGGYFMSDEDFSASLEEIERELYDRDWNFNQKDTL